MTKKTKYLIAGLIVAIIVVMECFSHTRVRSYLGHVEQKIGEQIDLVLED